MSRGRALLAVLLATLLVASGAVSASAATLTSQASFRQEAWSRCTNQPVTVTGAQGASTVALTGLDPACSGTTVRAHLASGGVTYTAPVTITGGTATVGAFSPPGLALSPAASALVTADGWALPTTTSVTGVTQPFLTCTTPAHPGATCTAVVTATNSWSEQWPTITTWNRTIEVRTTSATPVTWQVTINLDDPGVPAHPTRRLADTQGGLVLVSAAPCTATPRTVTVRGTTSWGSYHQVSATRSITFQVRGSSIAGTGNLLSCP